MISRKKFAIFAVASVLLACGAVFGGLLAIDLYLHHKYRDLIGLNVWGYRGDAAGGKKPNEWRLAVLGESTAFGYGVHWKEAFPFYLQERLQERRGSAPVTVLNLAYNNEGAHSFKYTLQDYDYLDYDAVLFYTGYNDIGGNTQVFRHDSSVFLMTGYLPLFPMIAKEKAMVIRSGGRLEDAYLKRKTTFTPNLAQRAAAGALEAAVGVSESLDRQFSDGASDYAHIQDAAAGEGRDCGPAWAHYCGEMYLAVKAVLDAHKHAVVTTQPYKVGMTLASDGSRAEASAVHKAQQDQMTKFVASRFAGNPRLRFVNLGHAVDLKDPALSYDTMHLTARGNQIIASALAPEIVQLIK